MRVYRAGTNADGGWILDRPTQAPDAHSATRENAQANLLRASKVDGTRRRNWALFVFFRIMNEEELAATRDRILQLHGGQESLPGEIGPHGMLKLDFSHPGLMNATLADPEAAAVPTGAFRNWLKALVSKDPAPMKATLGGFGEALETSLAVAMADGEAAADTGSPLLGLSRTKAEASLLDVLRSFMDEEDMRASSTARWRISRSSRAGRPWSAPCPRCSSTNSCAWRLRPSRPARACHPR